MLIAVSDVTERAAAEARLHLLHLAATRIGTSLDVYQTAAELCEVGVPRLADGVAVDVLDSLLHGEAPTAGTILTGQPLRRAGFFSVTGAQGVPAVGDGTSYLYDTPYDHVLAWRPCSPS